MQILKFGGKSLADGTPQIIEIIQHQAAKNKIAVVVSAYGATTDVLEQLLEKAKNQQEYEVEFQKFIHSEFHQNQNLSVEFDNLKKIFDGVFLLGDYNLKIKDQVLANGEIIASKVLAKKLCNTGINAVAVDSREIFIADNNFGNALVDHEVSRNKTKAYFSQFKDGTIPIVTGFIAKTNDNETVTLGRNGSNYSAALLANFLQAQELQNFTHVDGIYTANPDWVKDARKIQHLHFDDANELATLGASILHSKTIIPLLENNIPLRILNTQHPENEGTLISAHQIKSGIKSLSKQSNIALVQLEGRGLLGKIGVDARVFTAMAQAEISVGVISQGSSERGLGFVVAAEHGEKAVKALETEFKKEIAENDVSNITATQGLSVISIIGIELKNFDKAFSALVKNKIIPIHFSNSLTGKNVSLIIKSSDAKKAVNVIHGQIFGVTKKINLAVFGHGTVGGTLIDQILESSQSIAQRKNIQLNIFAIANSKKILLNTEGFSKNWKENLQTYGENYTIEDVIQYAQEHHLENLIAIDNTASSSFVDGYLPLIKNGFDLISSNKIANTLSYEFYQELRKTLNTNKKKYLYETNVGAGLPLIDTIKLLHLSGENITKIRGVFSGSLSYIFNTFCQEDRSFSEILLEAKDKGFTEPDPREDLSGSDVGRKLLILARELDLENEFSEIEIENLVPCNLEELRTEKFLEQVSELDETFSNKKKQLSKGHVLRFVGELSGDLSKSKGKLSAKLQEVAPLSPLGQLKNSDSLFEIYTESYGETPIIIQGAGAGAAVTARGVFGDILRLAAQ